MSINITSTSDRVATDAPTSSSTPEAAQEEGTKKYQGVSALMSAVPDPAAIAKLANEFSQRCRRGLACERGVVIALAQRGGADSRRAAGVPDYPREMFSFPAVPNAEYHSRLRRPRAR